MSEVKVCVATPEETQILTLFSVSLVLTHLLTVIFLLLLLLFLLFSDIIRLKIAVTKKTISQHTVFFIR